MSDSYPEYLNPFAEDVKSKNKLSISHSFKEFKRTLRQSFRIKKREEEPVTIRQKTDTIKRIPVSYPNYRTDALPRSRFHERLKCEPSTSNSGPNPFEEEDDDKSVKKLTLKKKTKKKAPLPPKSLSSQEINNDNLEIPSRGSHWSLTSGDTNYSSSIQENGGEDDIEEPNDVVLDKIIDFNKEMEKLQDDSNNNIITPEEVSQKNDSNTDLSKPNSPCPNEADSNKLESTKEETDVRLPQDNSESNSENDFDHSCSVENENEGLATSDITEDVIRENKINGGTSDNDDRATESNDTESFLYYEKQSLYIAGSRDELHDSDTYTNRVSIHISENKSDELDLSNNNDVYDDENQSDTSKDENEAPVPKQRKNKLTKSALLGM